MEYKCLGNDTITREEMVKDGNEQVLRDEEAVIRRWDEYSEGLLSSED